MQRTPFFLPHFSSSVYKLLIQQREEHAFNFILIQVLVGVDTFVLCVTISTQARALEAKAKTITLGWVD